MNDVTFSDEEWNDIESSYGLTEIAYENFELIEDNTIDVDSIEELDEEIAYTNLDYITKWNESEKRIVKQQNKILEAVKQLNKEIKELKEK